MSGSILIGEIEHKTNIGCKNVDELKTYFNAIDNGGYHSDDGFLQDGRILNTPEFKKIKGSQYRRGTVFKQDIVEYTGKIVLNLPVVIFL